jgi:hypothetical protein
MSPTRKPLIVAACLCEKVLRESDGVLSLIRIVDQFTVSVPPEMPKHVSPAIVLNLVVALKANGIRGPQEIMMRLHGPTKETEPRKLPFNLEGDKEDALLGVNLLTTIAVEVERFGPGRIDLEWQGELLTSVPFRVTRAQAQSDGGESQTPK